ncbi:YchJ family protein [Aeromicrobium halocynthiae]|uniref:YchJ family protein n=1 Tax=Aeromicrobium halocynthiae TaxID=560557 RepID=UPI0031CF6301
MRGTTSSSRSGATADDVPCPCGSGTALGSCCRPVLTQQRRAATAEELMRSRYTAYALRDDDHVFRTWHPRTRPDDVSTSPALTWTGLEVLTVEAGGPEDDHGVVEFRAHWSTPSATGAVHESSRFERRAGRWFYADGDALA